MQTSIVSRLLLCAGLLVLTFVLGACEGQLGIASGASNAGGGPPVLMSSPDAGFASSDAYFQAPDAFAPPSCTPSCGGRQCGPDGCGGSCGACAAGFTCNASLQCEPVPSGGTGGTGGTHAVTLYGTSSCGYCIRAREFFHDNGVTFADRNLEDSAVVEEAFNRVYELTGEYRLATPTIIIDDEVMLGWSEAACRSRLGL
ncbi:MAG: glutaredoxin family protein [Sandaracinaceae bacterium]|nr:glutaredoxin family protein [Sandaracinaceae bacterium]